VNYEKTKKYVQNYEVFDAAVLEIPQVEILYQQGRRTENTLSV
jgi:hypothetical protein